MSYVEHCKNHGQYHGEICGECYEDLKTENTRLREALIEVFNECSVYNGVPEFDYIVSVTRTVLEGKI